jgi:DNA-binding transcriptional MerR regulator
MSPTFLNQNGYRFYTHSNEEERKHVHVSKDGKKAKYWLEPIELAYNKGFNVSEINEIKKIIERYENEFKEKWGRHFC